MRAFTIPGWSPQLSRLRALLALLIGGCGVAGSFAGQAQSRPATRVDSVRALRDGPPDYVTAELTFADGQHRVAYLPNAYRTCFVGQLACYDRSPLSIPRPPLKTLPVARLREMTVEGHRYEVLFRKGKSLDILAENLTAAGPVSLYGYSEVRGNIPIPIPMGGVGGTLFVPTGTHQKYYWYLRPDSGADILLVPRQRRAFARALRPVFARDPELAARVARKEKGARVENLAELVRSFNERVKAK